MGEAVISGSVMKLFQVRFFLWPFCLRILGSCAVEANATMVGISDCVFCPVYQTAGRQVRAQDLPAPIIRERVRYSAMGTFAPLHVEVNVLL